MSVQTSQVEMCPTCRGKGREKGGNLPCLTCRGIGVIINIIKRKESFSHSSELSEESNLLEKTKNIDLTPDETFGRIKERTS